MRGGLPFWISIHSFYFFVSYGFLYDSLLNYELAFFQWSNYNELYLENSCNIGYDGHGTWLVRRYAVLDVYKCGALRYEKSVNKGRIIIGPDMRLLLSGGFLFFNTEK